MNENWYLPEVLRPPPQEPDTIRVEVTVPYLEERVPSRCYVVEVEEKWVSDALQDVFKRWCPFQPVGVFAPTGRGKTTFVNSVLKYCRGKTEVLYLSHRKMITAQQSRAMCRSARSKWGDVKDHKAFEYTDRFEDIGLTVMSYQRFAAKYRKMDLSRFGWVILDEAHYFYSDALFNLYLDDLLEKIPGLFRFARRVYMTATPGSVLPELCRAEAEILQECGAGRSCYRESCGKMLIYRFREDFEGIELSCFKKRDEIVELVRCHPGEKFLIFAAAREDGDTAPERSYVKLLQAAGIDVLYLDRNKKESDAWTQLCTNECFDAQVLVCTSVIDCGVNIRDDDLRHIVVETTDKTEFLQMIGRKRRKNGEHVRIYVRALGENTLRTRVKRVEEWLDIAKEAFSAITDGQRMAIIRKGWNDESSGNPYPHILKIEEKGRLEVKKTAYHALCRQKATLDKLLEDYEKYGDAALPIMVCRWLGNKFVITEESWLSVEREQSARSELVRCLAEWEGKVFSTMEWTEVQGALAELAVEVVHEKHDSERLLQYRAINNRFETGGVPFKIVSLGKEGYRIERVSVITSE